jgi:hypothetical protein
MAVDCPALPQVERDPINGAAARSMERALAQAIALRDLLVGSATDVRLAQDRVVQPATRTDGGTRDQAGTMRPQSRNPLLELTPQQRR